MKSEEEESLKENEGILVADSQAAASAPRLKAAGFMLKARCHLASGMGAARGCACTSDDRWRLPSGLSSFYSELMKGLGAGGRLWELLERKPGLPFDGGSAAPSPFLVGVRGVRPVLPAGGA